MKHTCNGWEEDGDQAEEEVGGAHRMIGLEHTRRRFRCVKALETGPFERKDEDVDNEVLRC
jgi:hypothetical protein